MTAEIAVLNKNAVALAADSAVTLGAGKKIFNTVNKLFALSKYYPVGIMVYGHAEFMGIPWETLIKIFRGHLKAKKFDTVKDYGLEFLKFLKTKTVTSSINESDSVTGAVFAFFSAIQQKIKNVVEEKVKTATLTESEIKAIVTEEINKAEAEFKKLPDTPDGVQKEFSKNFDSKYSAEIQEIQKRVFEKLPISAASSATLVSISKMLFQKPRFHKGSSGVVFAGFGEAEIFPAIFGVRVQSLVLNTLNYKIDVTEAIDTKNTAMINPFAQAEVVKMFVEGADRKLLSDASKLFRKTLQGTLDTIYKNRPTQAKIVGQYVEKTMTAINKGIAEIQEENFISPMLNIVASLPKNELAEMAESFISFTSFKRKMSEDLETVGGPIDVAVISKGDGFVWIKRKHYFQKDLNFQFFENYYS